MENAVETHGLTRRFGGITALDDLSLRVPPASVYAFLGLNGAGKTTTIRLLLGLQRPTRGDVFLLGRPMRTRRLENLREVGCLVETPSVYNHLTGRENLEVVRRVLNVPKGRIGEALRRVGLESAAQRLVREYSLGMKQRLGLAQCLLGSPRLLILDEPTNGLDPEGIHEVRELVRGLPAATGATVFLSSHILSEVEQVATHVGIVHHGRLRFQGTIESLLGTHERLLEVEAGDPARAAGLLVATGWEAREASDGRIVVAIRTSTDAARINRALVEAGHGVSRVAELPRTLESSFFGWIS